MSIQIAGNQPSFKAWAVVSSLGLGVMCCCAGVSVMFAERFVAQFDADLPGGAKLGLQLGIAVIVLAWCGYMALLAWAALQSRRRAWMLGLLVAWVVVASGYMGIVSLSTLSIFFRGTKAVM